MVRACLVLFGLVPVCVAHVLIPMLHPLPGGWPLALNTLPGINPGGNRRYMNVAPRDNYVPHDCKDITADWQTWEGGMSGNIRIKKDQPKGQARNIDGDKWEVEMVFDSPLDRIDVYDGVADKTSGNRIKVTSPSWRTLSSEDSMFSMKALFPPTRATPRLKGIAVNGKYHECKPPVATTKGARIQVQTTQVAWPKKVLGLYILLADDDEEGFESEATEWTPELFPWQQEASNVLFFTFIHPDTMDIPPSFQKLAATRGTGAPGAVPANTVIMFAIGGYAYSLKPNPWHWLTSKEAAEKMAVKVAEWPTKYGCDGIDLDLEEGAGAKKAAGPNMIHFIRKLRELWPSVIVSQPTYGYPQVQAEIDVINASWDTEGNHQGLADSIGLMVYEGTNALNYVKNYAAGSKQWQGFPIKVDAPSNTILLGAKGATSFSAIDKMANAAVKDDLLGIMVWYASVKNGFHYSVSWDASIKDEAIRGYKHAMKLFNKSMALNYVKNYAKGTEQWGGYGFPITVNAPTNTILLGAKGATSSSAINKMANVAVKDNLLGIMVWYSSVKNGFQYAPGWDANDSQDATNGYKQAMDLFNKNMVSTKDLKGRTIPVL